MSEFMSLELGAQTRAANLVGQAIPDVMASIDALGVTVSESATGFRGQSAAALAVALQDWFTVAGALPGILGRYAGNLAAVDLTVAASDAAGTSALETGGAGLGRSGLNMGPQ